MEAMGVASDEEEPSAAGVDRGLAFSVVAGLGRFRLWGGLCAQGESFGTRQRCGLRFGYRMIAFQQKRGDGRPFGKGNGSRGLPQGGLGGGRRFGRTWFVAACRSGRHSHLKRGGRWSAGSGWRPFRRPGRRTLGSSGPPRANAFLGCPLDWCAAGPDGWAFTLLGFWRGHRSLLGTHGDPEPFCGRAPLRWRRMSPAGQQPRPTSGRFTVSGTKGRFCPGFGDPLWIGLKWAAARAADHPALREWSGFGCCDRWL
jgi:hypothetical protein